MQKPGFPFSSIPSHKLTFTPKLTVTARFQDGRTERWEASAGTITFNSDPHFILLDVKSDVSEGIVPLIVNLMIDPITAKQVNASVVKYEIDYKDGTIDSGDITFDELINKIFNHTYLVAGSYTPTLLVYIKESTRKFEFTIPTITVSGTGVGGVYLLDDLSSLSFTNQPIVTFKVLSAFANPGDIKNSLKIKVKDEEGIETVTELDPTSQNQTISLSEGKNSCYFEISDSTSNVVKVVQSEVREIFLDTTKPLNLLLK